MSPRTRKTPETASDDTPETSAPKRRGRPPKSAKVSTGDGPAAEVVGPSAEAVAPAADTAAPKRRGRPPKAAAEAPTAPTAKAGKGRASAKAKAASAPEAGLAGERDEREEREEPAEENDREERADRDGRDERSDRGDRDDRAERSGRDERGRRGRRGGGQRRVGFNFRDLQGKILPELHLLAKEVDLEEYRAMEKDELVLAILERVAESEGLRVVQGYLEISSDGYGFLRNRCCSTIPGASSCRPASSSSSGCARAT